jgi:hypothetical protein
MGAERGAPHPFDKPMGGSERDGRSTANSGAIGATCQWRRGAPTGKPAACLCFQSGTCLSASLAAAANARNGGMGLAPSI